MTKLNLLQKLVYFDTAYIADLYEIETGESPKTQISKNQVKKAGANIPLFSAEISAQETRSFSVSSFEMLVKMIGTLRKEPELDPSCFSANMHSTYGWINGSLTVFKAKSTVHKSNNEDKLVASDAFFLLTASSNISFSLITTPEYFSSGLDTFVKLQDTILKKMCIPVKVYIRVMAAQDHADNWIAIPLIIYEDGK